MTVIYILSAILVAIVAGVIIWATHSDQGYLTLGDILAFVFLMPICVFVPIVNTIIVVVVFVVILSFILDEIDFFNIQFFKRKED